MSLNRKIIHKALCGLALPDALFIHDHNGRFAAVNQRACESLGYSEDELLNMSIFDIELDSDRPAAQSEWSRLQPGETRTLYGAHRRKDGSTFPVDVHLGVLDSEGQRLYLGIARDMTMRKYLEQLSGQYRSVIQASLDGFWITDSKGRILEANDAICRISGYSREELSQLRIQDIEADETPEETAAHIREMMEKGRVQFEARHRRKDGAVIDVEISVLHVPELNERFFAFVRDITERKRHDRIQEARLRLMEFARNHPVEELLVATLDEAGALTGSSIGFYHFLEADQKTLSLQAWSTRTTKEFCQAEGKGRHYSIDEAGVWVECVRRRRPVIHNDYASLTNKRGLPPGHAEVVREMVVPVFRNGLIVAILGVGNKAAPYGKNDLETIAQLADLAWDIAEYKRMDQALRESEKRWKFALEGAGDGVWDWNIATGEILFSRRWKEMLGYAEGEIGNGFAEWQHLIHPEDYSSVLEALLSYCQGDTPEYGTEYRLLCKDGNWKWVLSRGMITEKTSDGEPKRIIGTHTDISRRKLAELQTSFMAYHDRLTGLPNRSLLFDRLSQAIAQARRNDTRVALLFVDLDGFKSVNDNHGHEAGDTALKTVAQRLLYNVRGMDTVARMGGDEFVVILSELEHRNEAVSVANKLLDSLTQPIELSNGEKCNIGASIGISTYPDNGTEMDILLSGADAAMYKGKRGGGNRRIYLNEVPTIELKDEAWVEVTDLYVIGVPEIDDQHRELARLINTLNQAVKNKANDATLEALLENIEESTRVHFATEHELMERLRYPGQTLHDMAHDQLLAGVSHFKNQFNKGRDLFVLQSLKDWLLDHILTEDKRLGEFLAIHDSDTTPTQEDDRVP